jgi:hypothetical protein
MEEQIYTTNRGYKIKIRPLSGILLNKVENSIRKRYEDEGRRLEPPTFTFKTAGGDEEEETYTEETIKDAPEEDQKAWAEYLEDTNELTTEIFDKQIELEILESFELVDEVDDSWVRRQERFGIEVPEDPDDRRIHFFETIVMDHFDRVQAHTRVQILTAVGSVDDELIRAAEASFRRAMAEGRRTLTAQLEAAQEGPGMDDDEAVSGDESGEGVGDQAE